MEQGNINWFLPSVFNKSVRRYILPIGVLVVFIIAIFQDYLFANLKNTGFYIQESIWFNSIWLWTLPGIVVSIKISDHFRLSWVSKIALLVLVSSIHVLIFACIAERISMFLWNPSHHFKTILKTAFANQWILLLVIYTISLFYDQFLKGKQANRFTPQKKKQIIKLQTGKTHSLVDQSDIIRITTDKPYLNVITVDKSYLISETLTSFHNKLDGRIFKRVHRSTLVNMDFVSSVESRGNGDCDANLLNGDCVRLSRHFKSEWEKLLNHLA